MSDRSSKSDAAEQYRKNKQYTEAYPIFAELWNSQPNSYIGWRLANCLRELGEANQAVEIAKETNRLYPNDKFTIGELVSCLRGVGQLEDALHIARSALMLFPGDSSISNRLIWVLYDLKLKPAKDDSDLGLILQAADEIMSLNPNGLALQRVLLAVMKVAKDKNNAKWDVVLKWSEKVLPEVFDVNPKEYAGKRVMSDREIYYVSKSKALFELKRYEEARQQAEVGLNDFPNSFHLKRVAARSLAGIGELQTGAAEMRELQKHPQCAWYAKAELAELEHLLGNSEAAYRLMCEALMASRQSDEFKIRHLVTLAKIALVLQKPDFAAAQIQFAKTLRIDRDWKLPGELVQTEKEIQAMLQLQAKDWPELPSQETKLATICHKYWQDGISAGLERKQGVVLSPRPEKKHTFIKPDDGSEKVFIPLRNLPRDWQPGMKVSFIIKPSYDNIKQRDSFEAIDVLIS